MFKDPNPPAPILDHNDPRIAHSGSSVPIVSKISNAIKATARIAKSAVRGESLFADKQERDRRLEICNACSFWKPSGNLGFGECSHEKCGCTKLKQGLRTESCPIDKW